MTNKESNISTSNQLKVDVYSVPMSDAKLLMPDGDAKLLMPGENTKTLISDENVEKNVETKFYYTSYEIMAANLIMVKCGARPSYSMSTNDFNIEYYKPLLDRDNELCKIQHYCVRSDNKELIKKIKTNNKISDKELNCADLELNLADLELENKDYHKTVGEILGYIRPINTKSYGPNRVLDCVADPNQRSECVVNPEIKRTEIKRRDDRHRLDWFLIRNSKSTIFNDDNHPFIGLWTEIIFKNDVSISEIEEKCKYYNSFSEVNKVGVVNYLIK